MDYKKIEQTYFVRLDPGEDVVSSLIDLASREGIELAEITGIGAVNDVTLGVFDTVNKIYHATDLKGVFEITSLMGTLTRMEGKPYLHLHINLAGEDCRTYGGHLNRAIISATGEIVVRTVDGRIGREFSETIGLNLFRF